METDDKKIKREHTGAEIVFANRNSHSRAPSLSSAPHAATLLMTHTLD